jgi:hypothetical protein
MRGFMGRPAAEWRNIDSWSRLHTKERFAMCVATCLVTDGYLTEGEKSVNLGGLTIPLQFAVCVDSLHGALS